MNVHSASDPAITSAEFAQFLHDVVGPSLSAVGLQIELLRMDYEGTPALPARLREIQAAVDSLMEQVRECTNRLSGARRLST
jgi:signal transduction histidine kinase